MTPVRMLLAVGLLAIGGGCTSLQHGTLFRPTTEPVARPKADVEPSSDIFHQEPEISTARMSRYFPMLSRAPKPAPASSSESWLRRVSRNPELRAVPRPESRVEEETATAYAPPARAKRSSTSQPRPILDAHYQPAKHNAVSRSEPDSAPLLAATVIAETDPADFAASNARNALPSLSPAQESLRSARIAQASTGVSTRSIRRIPPVPEVNPTPRGMGRAPSGLAMLDREATPPRTIVQEHDRETRQVRARVEDAPAQRAVEVVPKPAPVIEEKPVVPMTEDMALAARSLDPPKDVAEAKPIEEPKPLAESTAVESKPKREPLADAPPPLDEPQAQAAPRPINPKVSAERLVAAPYRRSQFVPVRSDRIDNLPSPRFPDTYYKDQPSSTKTVASTAKKDPETKAARWTWTPRLIRRLRGEDLTSPPLVGPGR